MARKKGQLIPKGDGRWLLRVTKGRTAEGKKIVVNKTVYCEEAQAETELEKLVAEFRPARPDQARNEKWRSAQDEWVYVLELCAPVKCRPIKVGVSIFPEKRIKQLLTACPYPLRCLALWRPRSPRQREDVIHEMTGREFRLTT